MGRVRRAQKTGASGQRFAGWKYEQRALNAMSWRPIVTLVAKCPGSGLLANGIMHTYWVS
jgi:hypothetical protein